MKIILIIGLLLVIGLIIFKKETIKVTTKITKGSKKQEKASYAETILVVEDFKDARLMMKFLLEELGYRVIEAEDGWKAVEAVKAETPDLILMDMALPVINGLSATKLIRQIKAAAGVPIIALTASGQFIHQQALAAGCDALLEKPLDIDLLQPIITKYLPPA